MALGALLLAATPSHARAAQDFDTWLVELRRDAAAQGISQSTLNSALKGVQPIPRVLELDRRQPEGSISFATYYQRVVNEKRVETAQALYRKHKPLLDEVGARYGVPPRFILALWGIETDFGRNMGGFKVINALATLAHDGRRSAFFRKELIAALRILDEGHIRSDRMLGSWAGAMGQSQFMPTSFLRHAQDYDGDGRRDIWGTTADVFASIASYLSTVGWDAGETWGREVKLPPGLDAAGLVGLTQRKPLQDWQALGLRRVDGGALPDAALEASLIMPDGATGRAFLVYANYRTIMDWNRSTYFATTVGLLADRIGGPK